MNVCQDTIKVLIVDDQKLIRTTLKSHLDNQDSIEVLDCVASGGEALEKIDKLKPDIAIIDLSMPGMSGITTIEIIKERFPETKTIVLSSHEEKEYITQAITAGAKGYLTKGATPEEIAATIKQVNVGKFQLGAQLFDKSNNGNFANEVKSSQEVRTSEIFESEEDIPYIPTQVEVLKTEETQAKAANNAESENRREFGKIRHELMEILEFKVNLATKQKQEMEVKHQKLQTKFSWLFASQMVLFFVTIGCLSSLAQVQLKMSNLQKDASSINSVQLIR